MQTAKTVEAFLEKSNEWKEELTYLRELLVSTRLEETIKWGTPVYTMQGKNVVGMGAFQSYVGLWFFQGAMLKDTAGKLMNAQEGVTKAQRQWRFQSLPEIQADHNLILQYVEEATRNQEGGKVMKPAKNKPVIIPDELASLLQEDARLKEAFEALTLGRKRDYAEYIAVAKQASTRQNRLDKIRPMILEGIGLNDKYK